MAGLENPVIYKSGITFPAFDLADTFKVGELDKHLAGLTSNNHLLVDTNDADLDETLADVIPPDDIEQFLDLSKVKVEADSLESNVSESAHSALLNNSSDVRLTSHILSSIRKRFFPEVGSSSTIAHSNPNAQSNTCERRVKVPKLDQSCENLNNHRVGQNSKPDFQTSTFQYSPNMNSSSECSTDATCRETSLSAFHNMMSPYDINCQSNTDADIGQYHSFNSSAMDFVRSTAEGGIDTSIDPSMSAPKSPPKSRHLLPPCRVCGDQASGFHYGANTCEACKVGSV